MKLLPSIASADLLCIGEEIRRIGSWNDLHFDIEDGNFTPNITFGLKMFQKVSASFAPRRLDVHMMTEHPLDLLPAFSAQDTESICTHIESLRFPLLFLNRARQAGIKAGLALNFSTPLEAVEPFLPQMDYLLVMTSEPDADGENLNHYAFEKALRSARTLPVPVYADGGLGEKEVLLLNENGAAGCVLGRAVFSADDPLCVLKDLERKLRAKSADR